MLRRRFCAAGVPPAISSAPMHTKKAAAEMPAPPKNRTEFYFGPGIAILFHPKIIFKMVTNFSRRCELKLTQ
jgi:hypothetical protein